MNPQKLSEIAVARQSAGFPPVVPHTEDTDEHVVCQRSGASEGDGIIAEDVTHDTVLRIWRYVRDEKGPEELCQGAPCRPITDGIEDDLAAAIRVLLPARELVGTCQTDPFLKTVVTVCGPAQGPTLNSVEPEPAHRRHSDVRVTGAAEISGNPQIRVTQT